MTQDTVTPEASLVAKHSEETATRGNRALGEVWRSNRTSRVPGELIRRIRQWVFVRSLSSVSSKADLRGKKGVAPFLQPSALRTEVSSG